MLLLFQIQVLGIPLGCVQRFRCPFTSISGFLGEVGWYVNVINIMIFHILRSVLSYFFTDKFVNLISSPDLSLSYAPCESLTDSRRVCWSTNLHFFSFLGQLICCLVAFNPIPCNPKCPNFITCHKILLYLLHFIYQDIDRYHSIHIMINVASSVAVIKHNAYLRLRAEQSVLSVPRPNTLLPQNLRLAAANSSPICTCG